MRYFQLLGFYVVQTSGYDIYLVRCFFQSIQRVSPRVSEAASPSFGQLVVVVAALIIAAHAGTANREQFL